MSNSQHLKGERNRKHILPLKKNTKFPQGEHFFGKKIFCFAQFSFTFKLGL